MIKMLLIIVVIIQIIYIYFQYKKIKTKNKNVKYIYDVLQKISEEKSNQKILLTTDDMYIKNLLVEINKVLFSINKATADYANTKEEMKRMLSNISHDIKTPLTVILGYIEVLNTDNSLTHQERTMLLSKIEEKSEELVDLLNDFFRLSKIESRDIDITLSKINISEICRKSILSYYGILTDKNLDMNINIPNEDVYVLGNEDAMNRILNNLISNAITYGYEGKIIGLEVSADKEFVYIKVWDKGKGINEIYADRVFERLYTLEDSRNKKYQGSGLGLTITKKLVENLKGQIKLNSKPYEKTVFTIRLNRLNY
ncbi:sensor histidine kinase [Clostridiaceae bacterium M8S5]|nr:sensor histidine kinase [Clostridiaceae bacterium M8S5]